MILDAGVKCRFAPGQRDGQREAQVNGSCVLSNDNIRVFARPVRLRDPATQTRPASGANARGTGGNYPQPRDSACSGELMD